MGNSKVLEAVSQNRGQRPKIHEKYILVKRIVPIHHSATACNGLGAECGVGSTGDAVRLCPRLGADAQMETLAGGPACGLQSGNQTALDP